MRLKYLLLALPLIGFVYMGVSNITTHNQKLELKQIQLKDTNVQLKQLEQKYDTQLKSNTVNEQELKKLQDEKKQLEEQLQARAVEKGRLANLQTTPKVYAATAPVVGCTGNPDADFIYMKESGCNPSSVNSIGCRGIGQDCNGNLAKACPNWQTDLSCQDQFFTRYMQSRYGTWNNAVAFWESHHWW